MCKENGGKIDFVITWVNGNDEIWKKERAQYVENGGDAREARYRDWGQLKYWFRAIEKNASWVNKIHFVTCGHLPDWLNTKNPKLNIVRHQDFIPKEYLPVFNSTAIEIHLHKIPGLSEKFVYFCDDVYVMNKIKEEDFFIKGKAVEHVKFVPAIRNMGDIYYYHLYNNYSIYSKYVSKKTFLKNIYKYVCFKQKGNICKNLLSCLMRNSYLHPSHLAFAFKKETFKELWKKETEALTNTAKSRFRQITDVSPELFRGYQIIRGEFVAGKKQGIIIDTRKVDCVIKAIKSSKYKFICLSDNTEASNFEESKEKINNTFETVFAEKSNYEL